MAFSNILHKIFSFLWLENLWDVMVVWSFHFPLFSVFHWRRDDIDLSMQVATNTVKLNTTSKIVLTQMQPLSLDCYLVTVYRLILHYTHNTTAGISSPRVNSSALSWWFVDEGPLLWCRPHYSRTMRHNGWFNWIWTSKDISVDPVTAEQCKWI